MWGGIIPIKWSVVYELFMNLKTKSGSEVSNVSKHVHVNFAFRDCQMLYSTLETTKMYTLHKQYVLPSRTCLSIFNNIPEKASSSEISEQQTQF